MAIISAFQADGEKMTSGSGYLVDGETHYQRNKQQYIDRNRERRRRIRAAVQERKNQPCADCGVSYPFYVMQFDHVRGSKRFNLAAAFNKGVEAVEAEIAKCDVVCANCHAERTHRRR